MDCLLQPRRFCKSGNAISICVLKCILLNENVQFAKISRKATLPIQRLPDWERSRKITNVKWEQIFFLHASKFQLMLYSINTCLEYLHYYLPINRKLLDNSKTLLWNQHRAKAEQCACILITEGK